MKKFTLFVGALLLLTLFCSCSGNGEGPNPSVAVSGSEQPSTPVPATSPETTPGPVQSAEPSPDLEEAAAFFPIVGNAVYEYIGEGNEFASYKMFVDYYSDNKIQYSYENGGTMAARVVEFREDSVVSVYTKGEAYYRENFLEAKGQEEILLLEPIVPGTSWTLEDASVRTIMALDTEVMTPIGTYKAVEVLTESLDGNITDYYVKDLGLIKSVYQSGDTTISSTLGRVEGNTAWPRWINFFYPQNDGTRITSVGCEVRFNTNDISRKVLEEAYRQNVGDGMVQVFTPNTVINSLHINPDGIVNLDLSRDFVQEMNAGGAIESLLLQCVANTFGQYYNTDKVILTIENEPYSSGHFLFAPGEYLTVREDVAVEIIPIGEEEAPPETSTPEPSPVP